MTPVLTLLRIFIHQDISVKKKITLICMWITFSNNSFPCAVMVQSV